MRAPSMMTAILFAIASVALATAPSKLKELTPYTPCPVNNHPGAQCCRDIIRGSNDVYYGVGCRDLRNGAPLDYDGFKEECGDTKKPSCCLYPFGRPGLECEFVTN
ncbi:hypothetical protein DFH06DRAFT_617810 [Mycena polygramma]|nr:hypothetical protein DFH06DRAFT_617810 [Mycena polygramma]